MTTNRNIWSKEELLLLIETVFGDAGVAGPVLAEKVKLASTKLGRTFRACENKAYDLKTKPQLLIKLIKSSVTSVEAPALPTPKEDQAYTPGEHIIQGNAVRFPVDRVELKEGFLIIYFNPVIDQLTA